MGAAAEAEAAAAAANAGANAAVETEKKNTALPVDAEKEKVVPKAETAKILVKPVEAIEEPVKESIAKETISVPAKKRGRPKRTASESKVEDLTEVPQESVT